MKNTAIARILLESEGFDISKYDKAFLQKSLHRRITETQCESEEMYCTFLEQNEQERAAFLGSLLIGYS